MSARESAGARERETLAESESARRRDFDGTDRRTVELLSDLSETLDRATDLDDAEALVSKLAAVREPAVIATSVVACRG